MHAAVCEEVLIQILRFNYYYHQFIPVCNIGSCKTHVYNKELLIFTPNNPR